MMDIGSVTESNPFPTYDDAVREYLARFCDLIQISQQPGKAPDRTRAFSGMLARRAEEIAGISERMIELAQDYVTSADPTVLEGIRGHFIDQATAELLLGMELLQVSGQTSSPEAGAAIRVTGSAALREAISAVQQSASIPIMKGIPLSADYRTAEPASGPEAVPELVKSAESTARLISYRVQELGNDVCFDLMTGTAPEEIRRWVSVLSDEKLGNRLDQVAEEPARSLFLSVCRKVLMSGSGGDLAEVRLRDSLIRIEEISRENICSALVEGLRGTNTLKRQIITTLEQSDATAEFIIGAWDLMKSSCDRFVVLVGRIRRFEDAVRLAKRMSPYQLKPLAISLQIALLSMLLSLGLDYMRNCLKGISSKSRSG